MPQNKAFVDLVKEAKEAVKFLNSDITLTDEEQSEMIGYLISAIHIAEQELKRQEDARVFEGVITARKTWGTDNSTTIQILDKNYFIGGILSPTDKNKVQITFSRMIAEDKVQITLKKLED